MEHNHLYVQTGEGVRLFVRKLGHGVDTVIIPNAIYMEEDFERLSHTHTVILFDLRNRGRSDAVDDPAQLARGIEHDVDDIEAVRSHFGVENFALIGHSYVGLVVALYAMRHPAQLSRVVQISPAQPVFGQQYPAELCCLDGVLSEVSGELQALQALRQSFEAVEFCRQWWAIARRMFVADPALMDQFRNWGFCDLPNERNFMRHWIQNISPSLQRLVLNAEDFARAACPVLTVHGTKDRNAPYGGGVEWARRLPNAKLLTIDGAGHLPWVEAPAVFWEAVDSFLAQPPQPWLASFPEVS